MKSFLSCLGLLALTSAGTVHTQASRFGATPSEYRAASVKLASLEKDFVGLSRRYGVPMPTLRAIARGQAKAAPDFGSSRLRETMNKLAKDAAELRQQMAGLKGKVVALESAAGAGGSLEMKALSREFARASNLLDAGDLVGANLLLEHIKKDAGLKKEGGAKLWVDVVKAGALLQFLAGDIAGFDDALRIAKAGLVGDTVELVWELEQERGERLTEYGEMRQDVAMIERGANVLSTGAAPLLDDVPRVQQLRTMATLCRAKSSPFFERTLTSDNPEAWLAEFKKVLTLCSLAAKLADLTPEAPSSLRAHANVHNAFVLAWLYAVGVGDQNRVDAIMRLEQALSLIKGNGNEREIASIYIGAGDVYGVLNLLQKKRNFTVKEIDLYTSAVAVVNKSADPSVWASAHQRIGSTYFLSYKNGYRRDDLLFSKRHFEDAASVFTRDFSELAWARTLANLAAVRGYLGITDRSRTVVAASVLDLKTAEEALIGSSSQGVRTEAMRNRRILETWLMGNGRG